MCGIVGFVELETKFAFSAKKVIPEALFANQVRGRDAVGLFGVHRRRNDFVDWLKMAGTADSFLSWDQAHKRFFKDADDYYFMVGHNRAATIGKKDDPNAAHPHNVGNITLVHNGTLQKYPDKDKAISDSFALAQLLDEEPDFEKARKEISGAYALVWHDKRDQSLNFIRNDARPLSFIYEKNGPIWFASEPDMLVWLLKRNYQSVEKVEELKPHTLVKMFPGQYKGVETTTLPLDTKSTTQNSSHTGTGSEKVEDAEAARAFSTVSGRSAVLPFEKATVITGPLPPKEPDPPKRTPPQFFPTVPREGKKEKNKAPRPHYKVLEEWSGMKKGDQVFFTAQNFPPAEADATKNLAVGPLAVFVESERGVELVGGVIIRSRLGDKEQENLMMHRKENYHLWEAKITGIVFDSINEKILVFSKDAEICEGCELRVWGVEDKEVHDAYIAKQSAPEVAGEYQKK